MWWTGSGSWSRRAFTRKSFTDRAGRETTMKDYALSLISGTIAVLLILGSIPVEAVNGTLCGVMRFLGLLGIVAFAVFRYVFHR